MSDARDFKLVVVKGCETVITIEIGKAVCTCLYTVLNIPTLKFKSICSLLI